MSFIRALEKGRFTSIKGGLYSYPTEIGIEFCGVGTIPKDDFIEVMFRILERAGVKFNLKDVNNVRKSIYMKPIKRIKSDKETSKKYFDFYKRKKKPKRIIRKSSLRKYLPSWDINGTIYKGVLKIEKLRNLTGC